MRKLNLLGRALLLCLLSLLWLAPFGYCSETSEQIPEQVTLSMSEFKTLRENSRKQQELLMKLSKELQTAREQLQTSRGELTIVRNSLTVSQSQTMELERELAEQKQLSEKLQKQLTELQASQMNAKNSLEAANLYLQSMTDEIKAERQAREKTEKRLRQQKTLWQILSIACGVWAVAK